jgi:hypothetical protein
MTLAIYIDPDRPNEVVESWTFNFAYHTASDGTKQIEFNLRDRNDKIVFEPNARPRQGYDQASIERHASRILRA